QRTLAPCCLRSVKAEKAIFQVRRVLCVTGTDNNGVAVLHVQFATFDRRARCYKARQQNGGQRKDGPHFRLSRATSRARAQKRSIQIWIHLGSTPDPVAFLVSG